MVATITNNATVKRKTPHFIIEELIKTVCPLLNRGSNEITKEISFYNN
jgi:hypothetical protein